MKAILPLNGGINKDANPLYIDSEKGEVLHRKNLRVTSSDGGREGINVSIKGMEQITSYLPAGTNKCIGYVEDIERDRGIAFYYNSNSDDDIYVIDGNTITSLGVPNGVLSFSAEEIIDATILGDYCVFVSDLNPPRKIKITNDAGTGVSDLSSKDAYDIQLAVRPPSEKPTTQVASDDAKVVNKLIGKTFQFATFYIYNDYTYSVLSPYSDIVVSSSVFSADDNTYDNNAIGNYVQVGYNLGNTEVQAVKLLAREGNTGSWFVVEEYETNNLGGTRTYDFYNNVARQGLVEKEALALFSDVPRIARTTKAVQNRIGLANVLKGYDKTKPLANYSVSYEDVNVTGGSTTLAYGDGIDDPADETGDYYTEFQIPNPVVANTVISVSFSGRYEQDVGARSYRFRWEYSNSYVVQAGDTALDVRSVFINDISTKGISLITSDYGTEKAGTGYLINGGTGITTDYVGIYFLQVWDETGDDGFGGAAGTYTNVLVGTVTQDTEATGVSTFKGGSYYNVGQIFYDDFSRTSGVLNSQRVYIPHAGERAYADAFDRARMAFTLSSATEGVPSWAKYYRFAVTESVNFAGVYPFVVGNSAENIIDTYLDGKAVLAINMPTNLQYEFAKGDYLQIEVDSGSAITHTITKTIIGTRVLIDISGTDTAGFWLIVPKGDEAISTYDENLAYIYRLKNEVADLIYFEDSATYDITSGVMQTLTGFVGGEDAWYIRRKFEWSGGTDTVVVEDFYINVDDAIRAYSKGRVTVEFDTLGEIKLQDFVWSFNYLDNTKINGISTFNSLNRKQLDEKDGEIQRLELVGDVIKVVQDNKETSLYVGKAQISDASGNLQLVKSNDFIGTVNPSVNDYGSRHPKSIVKYNRDLYYWDGDHGEVVRSSANGQFPVSSYGMKSEFLRIKRAIESATTSNVFATYDVRNDEYVITFDIDGVVETWAFKEGADVWNTELEYTNASGVSADLYGNIGEQGLSFGFDSVWRHERTSAYNTFYGSFKQPSVKGVLNTSPIGEKCLRALEMNSNRAWNTIITTPVTNTMTVGQKSYLYPATYRIRQGVYTSSVFKNVLVASGEDITLIHSGTDMVGQYVELEFNDNTATEVQLRLVEAKYSLNS